MSRRTQDRDVPKRFEDRQPAIGEANQGLLPQHVALIEGSGITPEVAQARVYRSVVSRSELKRYGFGDTQCRVPALLIPIFGVSGEIVSYQIRPDAPRIKDGKPLKYETPRGTRMVVDVPPVVRQWLGDPARPLFITEGARKADSAASQGLCCVALLGVWNFRGSNEYGGKVALPDWESIALNGRVVYIAFDSDAMTKIQVHGALVRLKAFLESRGAHVRMIYLPFAEGGTKQGLDDFLAAGHTINDLLRLASDSLHNLPADPDESLSLSYDATPSGLVWFKASKDGPVAVRLTNFTAKITADVAEDDALEIRRLFEIEATVNAEITRFRIPATSFTAMNWPTEHLGAAAIVFPGFGLRDHARAAIQVLSGSIPERRVYAHMGWRQIDNEWVYLHAAGAIGSNGLVSSVEVCLSTPLGNFMLPPPPLGNELIEAVRSSLALLEIGPDRTTFPLYAAIPTAVIGDADFSIHSTGPTQAGKTELASLIQQHFGAGMDSRHLPASWSSTGNALEDLAFQAKDAVLVVDDFVPSGTVTDVQRLQREAERLFRAQGNRSGRLRMRSDATLRSPRPPRGLVVSTGEDMPRGHSLRARMLILEIGGSDLDWRCVTAAQQYAADGRFAQALAGFVHWLAPRYAEVRGALRAQVVARRRAGDHGDARLRTPEIAAHLTVGLHCWLDYAVESQALTEAEAERYRRRAAEGFARAAAHQETHQGAEEATGRFLLLVSAAIAGGRAHVAAADGGTPEGPGAWGWRRRAGTEEWDPKGERIGWAAGDDLFLEPEISFAVAQGLAAASSNPISVGSKTLHKRLHERQLLASVEDQRGKLTVRRTLEGRRRQVLHLRRESLHGSESAQADRGEEASRQERLAGVLTSEGREQNQPTESAPSSQVAQEAGPVGPVALATETIASDAAAVGPSSAKPLASQQTLTVLATRRSYTI